MRAFTCNRAAWILTRVHAAGKDYSMGWIVNARAGLIKLGFCSVSGPLLSCATQADVSPDEFGIRER